MCDEAELQVEAAEDSGVNWNRIAFKAPVIPAKDI